MQLQQRRQVMLQLHLSDQWNSYILYVLHSNGTLLKIAPFLSAEHVVSHPIMMHRRPGSLPGGDPASVLSPRSSETGALGVNMAEYVLGGSPVGKEFDPRFRPKAFAVS